MKWRFYWVVAGVVVLLGQAVGATAQPFAPVVSGVPPVDFGSVSWGDYDGDGRLDVLVTGLNEKSGGGLFAVPYGAFRRRQRCDSCQLFDGGD